MLATQKLDSITGRGTKVAFESREEVPMKAHVGDRITVESERVAQPPRRGVVEEVIQEDPQRLRVRWDDGHETIFAPAAGVALIEQQKKKKKTRTKTKTG
jgi:hypothetical protein